VKIKQRDTSYKHRLTHCAPELYSSEPSQQSAQHINICQNTSYFSVLWHGMFHNFHYFANHFSPSVIRLQNDLNVEWDVKPYYTLLSDTSSIFQSFHTETCTCKK